jgi:hypothetical protein
MLSTSLVARIVGITKLEVGVVVGYTQFFVGGEQVSLFLFLFYFSKCNKCQFITKN